MKGEPLDEFETADLIASWLLKKAKTDERIQTIIYNVQVFEDLKTHPAWRKLRELADKEKAKWMNRFTKRLWAYPEGDLPTPEEIVFHKGFFQGCVWVLAHPEMAEASLESAARAAWLIASGDQDEAEEALANG